MKKPRNNAPFEERVAYALHLIGSGCPPTVASRLGHMTVRQMWEKAPVKTADAMRARIVSLNEHDPAYQALAMKALRALGWKQAHIGAAFGVSKQRVEQVVG